MALNQAQSPLPLGGSRAARGLPAALGGIRSSDPQAVQNAFEALLMGELLKPLEESLRESGFVPKGAPGDMYASFWKSHLSELLARSLELLPAMVPEAGGGSGGSPGATGTVDPLGAQGLAPLQIRPSISGVPLHSGEATQPIRQLGPQDRIVGVRPRGQFPAEVPTIGAQKTSASVPPQLKTQIDRLRPLDRIIRSAAQETGLGANWLRAVITQESGGRADAVSRAGAEGLMQLMPATASSLGVADSLNPRQNVDGGARYLSALMRRFEDPRLALAAYNAGPTRVESYAGIPPYPETRTYVRKVMELKEAYDHLWPQDSGSTTAE